MGDGFVAMYCVPGSFGELDDLIEEHGGKDNLDRECISGEYVSEDQLEALSALHSVT